MVAAGNWHAILCVAPRAFRKCTTSVTSLALVVPVSFPVWAESVLDNVQLMKMLDVCLGVLLHASFPLLPFLLALVAPATD